MPKGYILATLDIPNETAYRDSGYLAMAERAVASHGGRFLIRGGNPEPLEGAASAQRTVVLEFPTRNAAAQFYNSTEYAPAITLRQSLSRGSLVLLSGTD